MLRSLDRFTPAYFMMDSPFDNNMLLQTSIPRERSHGFHEHDPYLRNCVAYSQKITLLSKGKDANNGANEIKKFANEQHSLSNTITEFSTVLQSRICFFLFHFNCWMHIIPPRQKSIGRSFIVLL